MDLGYDVGLDMENLHRQIIVLFSLDLHEVTSKSG